MSLNYMPFLEVILQNASFFIEPDMQSKLLLIDQTINYDGGKQWSCPPEDYVVLLLLLLRAY